MVNKVNLPCPHPDCNSSDAFTYETEGMYGGCFSCDNPYPMSGVRYEDWAYKEYPLKDNPKAKEEEITLDRSLIATVRESRGISTATMGVYGVSTLVDKDGKAVAQTYPYPDGLKTRYLPKKFSTEGRVAEQLFGMNLFNSGSARYVTVTEGELDALSVYQMLGGRGPVVSLPSSSPSKKIWEGPVLPWLNSFEKIYLSIDNDDKGDRIAGKLASLFPNKVYRVPHDKYKDANEFLVAGKTAEFKAAWWNAKKYIPENIWNTPDQFLKIFREEQDSSYLPTGIDDLDAAILGLMRGHFTVFQAPEGVGKCLHPEQGVLSYSGETIKAKDVKVGDTLMGPDSKSRLVLSTTYGRDTMYRITPTKGNSWVCNSKHILSLVDRTTGKIISIPAEEFNTMSSRFKRSTLQYRVIPNQLILSSLNYEYPKYNKITVELIGEGDYCGFTLDGDHLFLLDDFTVTHNSELMRYLEFNILDKYPDIPIAVCHMEETRKRSMLGLCSYKLKENVTRKDLIEEKRLTDKVEKAIISLTERENLFQFAIGVEDDPTDILDKIRLFSSAYGCHYIFFEPIQDLAYSRKSEDSTEGFLSSLATKLARLASELNVGIITIAHENDDGAIRDCRMIGKRASVVIKLERDMLSDNEEVRNTTDLLVVKNRPTGNTGFGGRLKFNSDSFTLEEKV